MQVTGNMTLDRIANNNSPGKTKTPKKQRPTLSPLMHEKKPTDIMSDDSLISPFVRVPVTATTAAGKPNLM